MRHLHKSVHPEISNIEESTIFERKATRAITLQGDSILMLYTERYHDYTLPGGGLNEGEKLVAGMIRELKEETGAINICDVEPFGIYEEYRPWYKADYDIQHMISYCFVCNIDKELGETSYEDYEVNNGMRPVWMNIYEAIAHNEETIFNSDKKGMSIERETFLLKLIVKELLAE